MGDDLDRVRRILRGGGMVLANETSLSIYRTCDARRGCIAQVNGQVLKALIATGDVQEIQNMPGRWIWAGGDNSQSLPRKVKPPQLPVPEKRAGTLLERVLNSLDDERDRQRITRIIMRFLGDAEAMSRGNVRVMSWEFVPRGQGAKPAGGKPGFTEAALDARQNLDRLQSHLGAQKLAMLEALIVREMSARQLENRFGLMPKEILPLARELLHDLARAYDLAIPADCKNA